MRARGLSSRLHCHFLFMLYVNKCHMMAITIIMMDNGWHAITDYTQAIYRLCAPHQPRLSCPVWPSPLSLPPFTGTATPASIYTINSALTHYTLLPRECSALPHASTHAATPPPPYHCLFLSLTAHIHKEVLKIIDIWHYYLNASQVALPHLPPHCLRLLLFIFRLIIDYLLLVCLVFFQRLLPPWSSRSGMAWLHGLLLSAAFISAAGMTLPALFIFGRHSLK